MDAKNNLVVLVEEVSQTDQMSALSMCGKEYVIFCLLILFL